ncbi:MAG: FAD-dependent oxidoreductase [Pseudomonadota bacterium]
MPQRCDAVVIGAGIIGTAIAYSLGQRGIRALVIDKLPICGYGATAASTALIHPLAETESTVALACEGEHVWQSWADYLVDADIDERGLMTYTPTLSVVLGGRDVPSLALTCDSLASLGIAFEAIDVGETAARFPQLSVAYLQNKVEGDDICARVFHNAGFVDDPQLATHNIMRAAEREGATFLYGERITEIVREKDRVCGVVLDSGDRIETAIVINAAGSHSRQVNYLASVESEMRVRTFAARQEVAKLPITQLQEAGPVTVMDADSDTYLRICNKGPVLAGKLSGDRSDGNADDPDHFDPYLGDQWVYLVNRARTILEDVGIPRLRLGVVELFDMSEDGQPIYDKTSLNGYYMAVGTSGHQFKSAPVVGELMAQIVDACESGRDLDSNPIDFYLPRIDHSINTRVFSRLREPEEAEQQMA